MFQLSSASSFKQNETDHMLKKCIRRSSAQTNLFLDENSRHTNVGDSTVASIVSTFEEHLTSKLHSTCNAFVPKSTSSVTYLTSLSHRKNSVRPAKLRSRPQVELNGITFNVECASTPKKQTPCSSTPKPVKKHNQPMRNVHESLLVAQKASLTFGDILSHKQLSYSNSSRSASDAFFATFFSNFVNLVNS